LSHGFGRIAGGDGEVLNPDGNVDVDGTGGAAAGPSNATFALGDNLEVIAPAAAALNGIVVTASPSATPGTCVVSFQNNTGAGITPVASTKYTILAKRFPPTFF